MSWWDGSIATEQAQVVALVSLGCCVSPVHSQETSSQLNGPLAAGHCYLLDDSTDDGKGGRKRTGEQIGGGRQGSELQSTQTEAWQRPLHD